MWPTLLIFLGCVEHDSPNRNKNKNKAIETVDTAGVLDPETIPPLTELCVNEFVADSEGQWINELGVASDWVELHNPTVGELPLAGYFITDDPEEPYKHAFDTDLVIPAGGFMLFSADNQPDLGPTHLDFKLGKGGEALGLFRSDGAGEVIHFGTVPPDMSWARQPDCCMDVAECSAQVVGGTPGLSNVEL